MIQFNPIEFDDNVHQFNTPKELEEHLKTAYPKMKDRDVISITDSDTFTNIIINSKQFGPSFLNYKGDDVPNPLADWWNTQTLILK